MLDNIETVVVSYRFLDETDADAKWGVIGVIKSADDALELSMGLENGLLDYELFDNNIFFYVHAYNGESLEELYDESEEFILIKEETN